MGIDAQYLPIIDSIWGGEKNTLVGKAGLLGSELDNKTIHQSNHIAITST